MFQQRYLTAREKGFYSLEKSSLIYQAKKYGKYQLMSANQEMTKVWLILKKHAEEMSLFCHATHI